MVNLLTAWDTFSKSDRQRRKKPKVLIGSFSTTYFEQMNWRDSLFTVSSPTGLGYWLASNFVALPQKFAPSAAVRARNKARASLRETGVNFANMLGEYKQTTSMLARNAHTLHGMIRKLKRKAPAVIFQPRKHWTKASADAWLEFTYGVKPLAQDLYDSYATWSKGSPGKPAYQRTKSTSRGSMHGIKTSGVGTTRVVESWTCARYDQVVAYVTMKNGGLSAAAGQFGLTNPASLVWELTTLSFVVDWFVNVGEVLGSLDNPLYLSEGITYCAGRMERNTQTVVHRRGITSLEYSYKGRVEFGSLGSTAELVYNPSVGIQRALSAVALLRQSAR